MSLTAAAGGGDQPGAGALAGTDGPTGEDKRPAARPCQFLISVFRAALLTARALGDTVGGRTCRATMTTPVQC